MTTNGRCRGTPRVVCCRGVALIVGNQSSGVGVAGLEGWIGIGVVIIIIVVAVATAATTTTTTTATTAAATTATAASEATAAATARVVLAALRLSVGDEMADDVVGVAKRLHLVEDVAGADVVVLAANHDEGLLGVDDDLFH